MSPTKRSASLRKQLACIALFATWTPVANATNFFTEAWDCAEGSAKAGYQLAGKGAKALEVLGEAPQCVAYATAGDVPLYATTGALFTLNAIDSSIVSSSHCVASVQSHAVVPLAKLLDCTFSDKIPAHLLDAGSPEATAQLWQFMANTPPISAAIDRIACGCTFLEAGISVQNLVEIFTLIAQAGEKCDKALSDVPGYQTVKAGVKAGGAALNNLGEDLFTDQVQHKDVEEYYFYDFDGGVDSYAAQSHAAARVLDPGHDWRTQEGATSLSDTVVKLGGGARNGEQYKNTCKHYFDSHKMSEDNAEEVCEAMVQRFDHDYKSMVPRMIAQDAMVKQLSLELPARVQQGRAECDQQFLPESAEILSDAYFYGFGLTDGPHKQCVGRMGGAQGGLQWRSPYAAVGSLGTPIDPAIIDAQLATGEQYFFVQPLAMNGAWKIGWEAFENNGGNAGAAVAQGLLAYEMMHDKILKDAHAYHEMMVKRIEQKKVATVKAAAGFAFSNCPAGAGYQECIDALGAAFKVCFTEVSSVPLTGEFPEPGEQAKIDAIEAECTFGYVGLAAALGRRQSQEVALRTRLVASCPGPSNPLRLNCLGDVQAAVSSCQGGAPYMTSGYFISKTFAQDPTAQVSCEMASKLFEEKWAADEVQMARINVAYSEAARACIAKVPDSGACQAQVGALADSCRTDLKETANILLGGLALQSEELGNAKGALVKNADGCIAQMMAIPAKLGSGKEAEVLMLSQYGNRCRRNEACRQLLGDTLRQCQGLPPAGATTASARRPATNAGNLRRGITLAQASNPVTAVMNNPSVFEVGTMNLELAKKPEQVVAECADELEAALAQFDPSKVPSVAEMQKQILVLPPQANTSVVAAPAPPIVLQGRPVPSPRGTTVTLQPGMDRMGGDYRGFALRQADPQPCRQACADDPACRSYTYVRPGLKGPQAMCFLKNSAPRATPDDCCTSGQKVESTAPRRN